MSPHDYEPMNTVITFPPGSKAGNTLCGSVDIIDDLTVEETERFTVTLESDSETVAVVDDSRSTHLVTIKDDDGEVYETYLAIYTCMGVTPHAFITICMLPNLRMIFSYNFNNSPFSRV